MWSWNLLYVCLSISRLGLYSLGQWIALFNSFPTILLELNFVKKDACSNMLLCLYKRRKLLQVTTDRTNLWYDNSAACSGNIKKKKKNKMKYQPQWIRIFKSIHLSLLLKVELDSFIYKRHSRDERSKKKALFFINGQWCLASSNLKIKLVALNLRDDTTRITCLWKQQLKIREWCL